MSETLELLDLDSLFRVREHRKRILKITAERMANSPDPPLQHRWDHEQATRALQEVEDEIEKRTSVI
jgi:hypothetical protein